MLKLFLKISAGVFVFWGSALSLALMAQASVALVTLVF